MKKLLFATFMLLILVGCTDKLENEEKTEQQKDHIEEVAPVGQEHRETESVSTNTEQQQANKKLSETLTNLYRKYGVIHPNHKYEEKLGDLYVGIVYSQLIDFDNDGQVELYILMKSSQYMNEDLEHRNEAGYVEEIWGITEQEAKLIDNNFYSYYEDAAEMSFIALTDGTTAIMRSNPQDKQFFTLQNQQFSVSDGELVGEETPIINQENGQKQFAIDLSEPISSIQIVMNQLSKGMNTAFDAETEALTPEIEAAIRQFINFGDINSLDSTMYESMIEALIFNQKIESDQDPIENYGAGFSEQLIKDAMKKYYSVDFKPEDLEARNPDSTDFHWLEYEDGVFYLVASEYYMDINLPTTEKIVKLSDALYFIKIQSTEFKALQYSMDTGDYFDYTEYIDVPFNEWPEPTQNYLQKNIPSYQILKESAGDYQLLYQSYNNLTVAELEAFLKQ
ncbi:hypothetical protein [Ureibacillus chungkukjangi]|uniref:Uncharacterized protein n=1 Tax=Ureibacillus chungkukjangi TaxID=1202712 RepID=A0A318TWZ7_9BACL|nr:hypothetical protein [Ureibacillus chungkukjangi]PYF08913.1 hypothetical protein BJ095_101134 [Ureibacillus chungkukjangi]